MGTHEKSAACNPEETLRHDPVTLAPDGDGLPAARTERCKFLLFVNLPPSTPTVCGLPWEQPKRTKTSASEGKPLAGCKSCKSSPCWLKQSRNLYIYGNLVSGALVARSGDSVISRIRFFPLRSLLPQSWLCTHNCSRVATGRLGARITDLP